MMDIEDWRENVLLGTENALRSWVSQVERAAETTWLTCFGILRSVGASSVGSDRRPNRPKLSTPTGMSSVPAATELHPALQAGTIHMSADLSQSLRDEGA